MAKVHTVIVANTRSYDGWVDNLKRNRVIIHPEKVEILIVDFSYANFLEPRHLVSLACLIEEYFVKGAEIQFVRGSFALNKYLTDIKFWDYWSTGFDRSRFTHTYISTNLCLWKVSSDMIDSYANQAKEYFEKNYFSGKDLEPLSITLKEVFNNIYDHSNSPVDGYVLTQYYPKKGEIITAVCDFGVGIPTKINEMWTATGRDKLNDEDALRAAFRRKVSSKSTPRNRGLGLSYLLSNVTILKGDLHVYSNNSFLNHMAPNGLEIYTTNQNFSGTLINIKLRTENLSLMEEEIEDQEFSF